MPSFVKLVSRIPEYLAGANAETDHVVEETAMNIVRGAMARSRVDTGNMQAGWEAQPGPIPGTWRVFNLVEYTIFNEFGTVYMSAQPMLTPATEENVSVFTHDVRNAWALGTGVRA